MSSLNQDLQASYQIISLLEKSKANSEGIIDRLPDMFMVIDTKGNILKGNYEAAKRFGVDVESLLGLNVSNLFTEETWNLFKIFLTKAEANVKTDRHIEFELNMDAGRQERVCYWTIQALKGIHSGAHEYFCVTGRDITLLRAYQKQLAEIFATIPLGIFTVDAEGKIDPTYSAYTVWLLGRDDFGGKSFRSLMYDPIISYLDSTEREGWTNLLNFNGMGLKQFDVLSETFPRQFFYPLPGGDGTQGRYLGCKVQSIAHSNKVNGLLILLEDRTAIVESEMADEKKRLLQDMSLDRALQIKKADPDLLKVALVDIKMLFTQLNDSIFTKNSEDFLNILHGIKGNARLVGFKQLLKMTHSLESKLREHKEFDWKIVFAHVDELRNEWREIFSLANVLKPIEEERNEKPEDEDAKAPNVSLFQDFTTLLEKLGPLTEIDLLESYIDVANRIKNLSFKPISGLENSLRIGVQKTADSVGKKVKLFFDWGDKIALDEVDLINIRTCLMHMTNNAIDHGLESVEERTAKQKPPFGNVQIRAIRGGDRLFITVQDDGKGINLEAVKKKAIANGLTTADQAAKLSDEEIVNFLFAQGFSTAEKVTDLSGRGVGMAAVADIVHKYHGEIKMYNSQQGGAVTEFYIYVPMNEFLEV